MRFSRPLRFVAPSAIAAVAGSVLAGLVEAVPNTEGPMTALAAVGFVAMLGVPGLLALGLVARALGRAWGLPRLFSDLESDHQVQIHTLAWGLATLAAIAALTSATFQILRLLFITSNARNVVAVGATLGVAATVIALVLLARPASRLLAWLISGLERRRIEGRAGSLLSRRRILVTLAVATAVLAYALWRLLVWRNIGHFDLSWLWPVGLGMLLFATAQVTLCYAPDRLLGLAGASAALAVLLSLGSAAWVQSSRPYQLLALWGDTTLAGGAVDKVFGVNELRSELDLGEFVPDEIPGATHPNVILITVDTVRADRTPIYGGGAKMPGLQAFAKRGLVFDWAFAPGNVTRRSIPSIATGLSPRRVRGRVAGWALRLDPRHVLLAERFKAAGYRTAGFFCCRSHFGKEHKLGLIRGLDHLVIEYQGAKLSEMADEWLGAYDRSAPLFMWIHLIEPHNWNKDYPSRKHGANKRRRYDMSLAAVDEALRPLFSRLSSEGFRDDTLVVVTADHGEGLGEHGVAYHAGTLYNSEIRVPLVVVGPGVRKGRVMRPVSLVDIAPSLLELA
ncbi:MAG: sulfatase, partial [Deltaproteobacteria bacterium]|nr:sulfatase [Deltaproteobacteria bacterium]